MCGLFGIVNHHKRLLDKRAFITLGCDNDSRGGDACGIMIDGNVERGTDKDDQYFQYWYSKSKLLSSTEKCYVALGHCRKASVGGKAADKAQPVTIYDSAGKMLFCLIHNGTIYNYKELAKKYIPEVEIKDMSDSQVMAHIFYYKGYDVLAEYQGAGAFVIQDYRTNKTYMFRGESRAYASSKTTEEERPLFFVRTGKSVIFSSTFAVLQGLFWGFDVYYVPTNILLECDGTDLLEVAKYDRTQCSHSRPTAAIPITNYEYALPVYNSSSLGFDPYSGTYYDTDKKEELHGVQYISPSGYISKYSTGYNDPYYFWRGIMLSGENAYNALRKLQADLVPMSDLVNIAKRLSCNPTLSNKRYYTYDSDNKRIPFTDTYTFPLTDKEIVCNRKGKLLAYYSNLKIDQFIPVNLPKDMIDKIIDYVLVRI